MVAQSKIQRRRKIANGSPCRCGCAGSLSTSLIGSTWFMKMSATAPGLSQTLACVTWPSNDSQATRATKASGGPSLSTVTYEELLQLIERYRDEPIQTVRGSYFTVGRHLDAPVFIPISTGLGRSDGRKAAEKFLDRFNLTGSLRPSEYGDLTRNASYLIGLILHDRDARARIIKR